MTICNRIFNHKPFLQGFGTGFLVFIVVLCFGAMPFSFLNWLLYSVGFGLGYQIGSIILPTKGS